MNKTQVDQALKDLKLSNKSFKDFTADESTVDAPLEQEQIDFANGKVKDKIINAVMGLPEKEAQAFMGALQVLSQAGARKELLEDLKDHGVSNHKSGTDGVLKDTLVRGELAGDIGLLLKDSSTTTAKQLGESLLKLQADIGDDGKANEVLQEACGDSILHNLGSMVGLNINQNKLQENGYCQGK